MAYDEKSVVDNNLKGEGVLIEAGKLYLDPKYSFKDRYNVPSLFE